MVQLQLSHIRLRFLLRHDYLIRSFKNEIVINVETIVDIFSTRLLLQIRLIGEKLWNTGEEFVTYVMLKTDIPK